MKIKRKEWIKRLFISFFLRRLCYGANRNGSIYAAFLVATAIYIAIPFTDVSAQSDSESMNGNNQADFYENFNKEVMAASNFHAFNMNLETDYEGNFYFAKATPWPPWTGNPRRYAEITPHHGVLFRLSPDGEDLDIIATGLRNPNGLTVGPDDEILYADNEGNYIPTSFVQ